jgi:acylphosphatase
MIVHGRVQDVGFRYFTQQQAALLNINGMVANRDDGTVEIDAEGEEAQMERFLAAIKKGHMFAKVERVDCVREQDLKHYRTFKIIY